MRRRAGRDDRACRRRARDGARARRPLRSLTFDAPARRSLRCLERDGEVPLPPYIERAAARRPTPSATRRSTRASRAPWRRRPRACTSTRRCSRRSRRRGVERRVRDAARRRGHVPAGARARTSREHACTASASASRGDRRCDRATRARGGARRRRRHHDVARARVGGCASGELAPGAARPRCSSRRAFAFASSTAWSPTSTCRASTLLMLVSRVRRLRARSAPPIAHAVAAALPLLQLWRRDAARADRRSSRFAPAFGEAIRRPTATRA